MTTIFIFLGYLHFLWNVFDCINIFMTCTCPQHHFLTNSIFSTQLYHLKGLTGLLRLHPTLLKPFSPFQFPCWEFPLKSPFESYHLLDLFCQTIHDRLPPQNNRRETTTDFYRFSAFLLPPRLFLLSLPLFNCCDSPVKETQLVIFVVHNQGFSF